ncbi:hypothetical protein BJX68DRAFT_173756 [Aspergillus pseudodeflectus]|uniref:Secreted protein n=1 Tax=Aspergillus pseudodeflectus TaxID=176178 RepID=A0ABR4JMU7_9EURO
MTRSFPASLFCLHIIHLTFQHSCQLWLSALLSFPIELSPATQLIPSCNTISSRPSIFEYLQHVERNRSQHRLVRVLPLPPEHGRGRSFHLPVHSHHWLPRLPNVPHPHVVSDLVCRGRCLSLR